MEQPIEQEMDFWEKIKFMLRISARAAFIPTPKNYAKLAEEIQGSKLLARLWFFVSVIISQFYYYVYAFVLYYVVSDDEYFSASTPELGYSHPHILLGIILFSMVCGGPFISFIRTLIFSLRMGLQNWLANLMKGEGEVNALLLINAGFTAPLLIIKRAGFFLPFANVPEYYLYIIIPIVSLIINLYQYVLSFFALRAVKKIHWAKTLLILLIDMIVTIIVFAVLLVPMFIIMVVSFD